MSDLVSEHTYVSGSATTSASVMYEGEPRARLAWPSPNATVVTVCDDDELKVDVGDDNDNDEHVNVTDLTDVTAFNNKAERVLALNPFKLSRFFTVQSRWRCVGPLPGWPAHHCRCRRGEALCWTLCAVCFRVKYRDVTGCIAPRKVGESKCANCAFFEALDSSIGVRAPCQCGKHTLFTVCTCCLGIHQCPTSHHLARVAPPLVWTQWSPVPVQPGRNELRAPEPGLWALMPAPVPVPAQPGHSGLQAPEPSAVGFPHHTMARRLHRGREQFEECESEYGPALRPV